MESFCQQCNYHLAQDRVFLLLISFSSVVRTSHHRLPPKEQIACQPTCSIFPQYAWKLEESETSRVAVALRIRNIFSYQPNGPPTVPFFILFHQGVNGPTQKTSNLYLFLGRIQLEMDKEQSIIYWPNIIKFRRPWYWNLEFAPWNFF